MSRVVVLPGDPELLWGVAAMVSMAVAIAVVMAVVDSSRTAEVETLDDAVAVAEVVAVAAAVARTSLPAVVAEMN